MATLFVRDVPDELYERLRAAAQGSRRSIGATTVEILGRELSQQRGELSLRQLLNRSRSLRERATVPDDGQTVADDIRRDRDR